MPDAAARAAAAALSSSPPDNFATREDAERHFRATEEGTWTGEALRRLVGDIMMRDGAGGPWRFPYAHARLRRLRAFSASPANDFKLFDKAKAVRCPVLVFRGGMSKRFPPDAEALFLQQFTAKPELVVCPTSGHFPTATEPAIVVAALKRFLDGLR
jgi:pimeloyl-ACP methyl ester carboxylesterase